MTFESALDNLADPDERLSAAQLASLSNLDREDLPRLREIWPEINSDRKRRILEQLTELAEDNVDLNFERVFKLGLEDEDGPLRAQSIRGLYEYEGRDIIPTLATLLREDPDMEVRRECAIALGRFALEAELDRLPEADREAIREVLTESTEDANEEEEVRAKAIEALGALSGEETDNLIESIYAEDSLSLKIAAVDAMGRSCNDLWLPTVLRELGHRAPIMRHAAAFAAGEIAEEEAVAPLQRTAIQDQDREVRLAAIHALGEIGGARAKVALKTVLFEGNDEDREAVEETIRELSLQDDPLRPI